MKKTADITSYLSSVDVARILGVNVATVKRWTDSGKLDCVKTAGGHRKFLLRHLAAFAGDHEKYAQRLSLLPLDSQTDLEMSSQILQGDFDELVPLTLERAINADYAGLQTLLNGLYMVNHDLTLIYDKLLTPVLHEIGHLWMDGKLTIPEEHLASQAIRDSIVKLQDIVIRPKSIEGRAFVLTFADELHDIPAKMVQHLLEVRGYQTIYSGQSTPTGDTEIIFETYRPDRAYLSTIYIEDLESAQQQFDLLVELCARYGTGLYAGGGGLDQLKIKADIPFQRLHSFQDILET